MADQKAHLQKVGWEGFQLIDECYGRHGYSSAPQVRTVFQEPVRSSTAYVVHHGQYQVPAGKQSYQVRTYNNKVTTVKRDSHHVPHVSRPIEPSINGTSGSVTWHVYKVTQVPEPAVITSDQAVKNYGGIMSKQYYR